MITNDQKGTQFLKIVSKNFPSIIQASLNKVGFEGRKEMISYIKTANYPAHSRVKDVNGKLVRKKRVKHLGKLVMATSYYLSANKDAVFIGFPSSKKQDLAYRATRSKITKHKQIIAGDTATKAKSSKKPSASAARLIAILEKGAFIRVNSRLRAKYERSVKRLKRAVKTKTGRRDFAKNSIRPIGDKRQLEVKKRSTIEPVFRKFSPKIGGIFENAAMDKINRISKRYK